MGLNTRSTPRHLFKAGTTQRKLKPEVIELFAQGVGPLSIAVRLNVSARRVLDILSKEGHIEDYEPQSWSLNGQFI